MRKAFVDALDGPKGAVLSEDRQHRYWLWRIWNRRLPILVVCMFNPSRADAYQDDPTIDRLCKWAKLWGYGGILVINLYSLRSSNPAAVRGRETKAFGDDQPRAIAMAIELAQSQQTPILCAWGNLATDHDRKYFIEAADGCPFICLGWTKFGAPKHPMARGQHRIPDNQQPIAMK